MLSIEFTKKIENLRVLSSSFCVIFVLVLSSSFAFSQENVVAKSTQPMEFTGFVDDYSMAGTYVMDLVDTEGRRILFLGLLADFPGEVGECLAKAIENEGKVKVVTNYVVYPESGLSAYVDENFSCSTVSQPKSMLHGLYRAFSGELVSELTLRPSRYDGLFEVAVKTFFMATESSVLCKYEGLCELYEGDLVCAYDPVRDSEVTIDINDGKLTLSTTPDYIGRYCEEGASMDGVYERVR